MRENLSGRNGSEKFPINWDQPPSHKSGDCGNEPGNFLRLCGISALATASLSVGGQDRHLRTLSVVEALVPSACLFSSALTSRSRGTATTAWFIATRGGRPYFAAPWVTSETYAA